MAAARLFGHRTGGVAARSPAWRQADSLLAWRAGQSRTSSHLGPKRVRLGRRAHGSLAFSLPARPCCSLAIVSRSACKPGAASPKAQVKGSARSRQGRTAASRPALVACRSRSYSRLRTSLAHTRVRQGAISQELQQLDAQVAWRRMPSAHMVQELLPIAHLSLSNTAGSLPAAARSSLSLRSSDLSAMLHTSACPAARLGPREECTPEEHGLKLLLAPLGPAQLRGARVLRTRSRMGHTQGVAVGCIRLRCICPSKPGDSPSAGTQHRCQAGQRCAGRSVPGRACGCAPAGPCPARWRRPAHLPPASCLPPVAQPAQKWATHQRARLTAASHETCWRRCIVRHLHAQPAQGDRGLLWPGRGARL